MNKLKLTVIEWVARRLPPCEVITQRLSQAQDGRLPWRDRQVTRLHLLVCGWCTNYSEHLRLISKATRARAADDESTKASRSRLPDDAKERMKKALRESGTE